MIGQSYYIPKFEQCPALKTVHYYVVIVDLVVKYIF